MASTKATALLLAQAHLPVRAVAAPEAAAQALAASVAAQFSAARAEVDHDNAADLAAWAHPQVRHWRRDGHRARRHQPRYPVGRDDRHRWPVRLGQVDADEHPRLP